MKKFWFSGTVGFDLTPASVTEQLRGLAGEEITVNLNTPGGIVYDGIEIYNILRQYPGRVVIKMGSLVASAGSLIACAGDEIVAQDFTSFMIHEVQTFTSGTSDEIREEAERVDELNSLIARKYADRSGKPEAEIRQLMKAETWLYGREIVDAGFADRYEDTGTARDRQAAVASAMKIYRQVASAGNIVVAHAKKEQTESWLEEAKSLIEAGKINTVDDSEQPIRDGVVYRSALRRIVSRAPEDRSQIAGLISMIDKRGKAVDRVEILSALATASISLEDCARAINQTDKIMSAEAGKAVTAMAEICEIVGDNPVAAVKALSERVAKLEAAERQVALDNAFGLLEGNDLRAYAEKFVAHGIHGDELAAAIEEVKNDPIAKKLAAQAVDPFAAVNVVDVRPEYGAESPGVITGY